MLSQQGTCRYESGDVAKIFTCLVRGGERDMPFAWKDEKFADAHGRDRNRFICGCVESIPDTHPPDGKRLARGHMEFE